MTPYLLVCAAVFAAAYLLNITMISVFYHRGLAHQALDLKPWMRKLVIWTGIWVTGLDPKGWVVMHRRHHKHSDSAEDPHSPVHYGILGVMLAQLKSYERTLVGLARNEPEFTVFAKDLDFRVNWLNRKKLWILPYVVHLAVTAALAVSGFWLLGACYYFGMMSHPVQGWIVNAFGHARGGRNFDTPDNSRNNHLAAWLIAGEGFQNNHHRYPTSARFSYRFPEVDMGYGLCLALEFCGLFTIRRDTLIPAPEKAPKQPPKQHHREDSRRLAAVG
ncbi:acyl-CoA desaturase [Planctomycetota bacterium]|nr:acyl-CoA desaturase [Planctomycetota bacterium]